MHRAGFDNEGSRPRFVAVENLAMIRMETEEEMDRDGMDTRGIRSDHPRKTMNRKILGNGRSGWNQSGCFLRTVRFSISFSTLSSKYNCVYISTLWRVDASLLFGFSSKSVLSLAKEKEKKIWQKREVSRCWGTISPLFSIHNFTFSFLDCLA